MSFIGQLVVNQIPKLYIFLIVWLSYMHYTLSLTLSPTLSLFILNSIPHPTPSRSPNKSKRQKSCCESKTQT